MFSELLRVSTALVFAAAPVLAQGTGAYFNVESPQRKPITVARVAGHDYLVACNTPDNCVEIYDTHKLETDLPNAFLLRVQTGAEPISVVYNGELGRLFTCNFLGDSVSMIALSATGSSGPLSATLLRTTTVGDEPNHIAFAADNASLYVTLGSQGQISRRSTTDLSPVGSGTIDLLDNMTLSSATKALGSPSIALRQGNQLFVLANRGGKALVPPFNPNPDYSPYDFDVWTLDLTNNTSVTQITGLGTANFNMAFSKAGDLWVVGTDAQFDVRGESAVATTAFGFVRSKIYRIANPGAGATAPTEERDLNKNPSGAQVTKARALGQPTDLALYEPGATLQKVYVAAFNSDLVGSITPVGSASTWVITPITIPKYGGSTNPRSGPRGLAIKYVDGVQYDPGNRIYVLNRLDNAISVIDPSNDAVLLTFALRRDPTPQYIRTGRKFLYGANLSGSGIVSCASCHVDGRSDWLNWDLNGPGLQMFPTNANNQVTILDAPAAIPPNGSATSWPINKSFLITQTLQGMVNFETLPDPTDPNKVQSFFTNEPLHWRGDRATFQNFQPAFEKLLGLPASSPLQPSPTDMDAFARFVFSIAYPPNPEEPADRVFSGTLGDPSDTFDPPDPQAGSGAQRGLKLFHILRVSSSNCSGRSCVQCHWLPEGSNNKISLFVEDSFNSNNRQPLETPTIRLLRQKEGAVIRGQPAVTVKSALFGLLSQGNVPTINDFVLGAFALGPNPPITPVQAADITRFVREVDSGVGPLVGQSYSINTANVNDTSPGGTNDTLNLWEQQSLKANHGLAVQANLTGLRRGFWFDPIPVPPVYREEPVGAVLTRSALLALVTQSTDLLVVHATPLGSERRFAWPNSGNPPPLAGLSPTNITLEPMRPNTAYAPVPQLTKNWIPVELGGDFNWTGDDPPGTALTPPFVKLVRIFQRALLNQYGLTALRHEAPRRFRVAMDNGRHGARLSLKMATDTTANSPQNSTTFLTFELPVYPTSEVNAQGRSIWETAVEADPLTLYTLMLGGPAGTKVQETLDDPFDAPEPPPANYFNPVRWNSYLVEVKNEDGTTGSGGWQPITIQ